MAAEAVDGLGNYIGRVSTSTGRDLGFGRRLQNGTEEAYGGWEGELKTAYNDLGDVVSQRYLGFSQYSPFVVGPGRTPTELAGAQYQEEYASAIDNNGVMGGQVFWGSPIPGAGTVTGPVPILWNPNGSIRTILSSPGMVRGSVTDINRVGEAAGLVKKGGTQAGWYATVWDINTGIVKRETPVHNTADFEFRNLNAGLLRINDHGEVVVAGFPASQRPYSFWSGLTGSVLVPSTFSGLPSGARLLGLSGFSNDRRLAGDVFTETGQALNGYYFEPVPEPASFIALSAGLAWILRRRRKSQ